MPREDDDQKLNNMLLCVQMTNADAGSLWATIQALRGEMAFGEIFADGGLARVQMEIERARDVAIERLARLERVEPQTHA